MHEDKKKIRMLNNVFVERERILDKDIRKTSTGLTNFSGKD